MTKYDKEIEIETKYYKNADIAKKGLENRRHSMESTPTASLNFIIKKFWVGIHLLKTKTIEKRTVSVLMENKNLWIWVF